MISRRHRRPLAMLVLAAWLFAMFVGISHACSPQAAGPMHVAAMDLCGMDAESMPAGDGCPSANCLQFCADDTPVSTKLQFVHGEPAGHPVPASIAPIVLSPALAPAIAVAQLTHPPPDAPVLLRSLRFAL